jgi:hypothetical protein
VKRTDLGKRGPVRVGRICASCSRCGGEQFVRVRHQAAHTMDVLHCAGCGAEHYYTELLQQIAAKVIAQSERLLNELHDKADARRR